MDPSSNASTNFQFSFENLEHIPHPDDWPNLDDNHSKAENQPFTASLSPSSLELPQSPQDLFNRNLSKSFNESSFNTLSFTESSSNFIPPLPLDKDLNNLDTSQIPLPKNFDEKLNNIFLPESMPHESSNFNNKKNDCNTQIETEFSISERNSECEQEEHSNLKNYIDDNKYSPSKVESDEENQDFATTKPKVLGKEQAKKRLMAFSLSKLPNSTPKKQNKVISSFKIIKEKPPNPNKSSGVQEQFRTTISEIEEEKKKMMKNMPSYLLLEMNDLVKSSNVIIKPSTMSVDKSKTENSDLASKSCFTDKNSTNKSKEYFKHKEKKTSHKSRSKSKSRSRSRSRNRSRNKNRKRKKSRSLSKSRRRRSKSADSYIKSEKLLENWKSFKKSEFYFDVFLNLKFDINETKKATFGISRGYSKEKSDFKPNFNYLKTFSKPIKFFRAKSIDSRAEKSNLYSEKTIKYTTNKPMIMWSENPSCATEFYMPKNMLLENCDQFTASVLYCITTSKNNDLKDYETGEIKFQKSRDWYPRNNFLISSHIVNEKFKKNIQDEENFTKESEYSFNSLFKKEEDNEVLRNSDKKINCGQDYKSGKKECLQKKGQNIFLEKQISLVNDSYLSDEELDSNKIKEMIVGDVKVHVDLDLNSVKVPSKWDSDYENENFEKHSVSCKEVDMEIASIDEDVSIYSAATIEKSFTNEFLSNPEFCVKTKNSENTNLKNEKEDQASQKSLDTKTENLASEYEEFLKMVSFDSSFNTNNSTKEKLTADLIKPNDQKNTKTDSEVDFKESKIEVTNWDRESDNEEIYALKMSQKSIESNSFLNIIEEKSTLFKKEKKKKLASKKTKTKKNKQLKKRSKQKKKKYNTSTSSDSNSDSYNSESDSESDKNKSKKKRKKISKSQKKSKTYLSSESDSDSESSVSSKDQNKKKNTEKKKRLRSNSADKGQNVLLKELDFKKQLIMKKIEAIDFINEKNEKKKEKMKQKKKENYSDEESDSQDKNIKLEKKKMFYSKTNTNRKKFKSLNRSFISENSTSSDSESDSESDSDSDSESTTSKVKNKKEKVKKTKKKKRCSSESSTSEENLGKNKAIQNKVDKLINVRKFINLDKDLKNNQKVKKLKKKCYTSSDSEGSSLKSRKKIKKNRKKNKIREDLGEKEKHNTLWQDSFLFKGDFKTEDSSACLDDMKLREKDTTKKYTSFNISKEKNDWEANSSFDESAPDNKEVNSSWDDEIPSKTIKEKEKENNREAKNFENFKINSGINTFGKEIDAFHQEMPTISKNSMSNTSFCENTFNSFEQGFSINFLLHEPSFSNSAQFGDSSNLENCTIEARPFQSISKPNTVSVHSKSELYSPGHSDSELSDAELQTKINEKINNDTSNISKDDIYDPLNSESEGSQKNMEVELSSIPLPSVSDILLPGECKNESESFISSPNLNNLLQSTETTPTKTQKYGSTKVLTQQDETKSTDFPSVSCGIVNPDSKIYIKKQIISMKSLQKLKSKAASVFQDESDEEITEAVEKIAGSNSAENEDLLKISVKAKNIDCNEDNVQISDLNTKKNLIEEEKTLKKNVENDTKKNVPEIEDSKILVRKNLEKKDSFMTAKNDTKLISPILRTCETPEFKFNNSKLSQQEIKSDSFEIEPLERISDCKEEIETLQTIPVLTGLGIPPNEGNSWTKSHLPGYTSLEFTVDQISMIDNSESFDIYPSEDSKYRDSILEKDRIDSYENNSGIEKFFNKTEKNKKERKKSRSRSLSPRKKRRSRSPDRRRSPKRKNSVHKYKNESPYSPRRRSPKRKSPSRWHKSSRSPDRRRKSRSRSPRKRRSSSFRRSRSFSPRKHRSPKRRPDSPRRRESQSRELFYRESVSPKKDFSHHYSDASLQNRIPVIGTLGENDDIKLNNSALRGSPTVFSQHLSESAMAESDVNNSFYNRDYLNEFGVSNYSGEVSLNNLITVKNHEFEKSNSPERLSLDQRIELELGVQLNSGSQCQNEHYPMQNQVPFSDINSVHFSNSYNCDNNSNENFYQNQNIGVDSEFNNQFFNGHQQLTYGSFQQFSNNQPIQNSVLQVGNIVEVVPTMQHTSVPPPSNITTKPHQIMQVGNVLQVVPSQKSSQASPENLTAPHGFGHPPNSSPLSPVKTQKATAVVAPSSIVPPPNPDTIINPLIKAIQLEREKRKKEKEKRKSEREARRKARQLRREAKLMSVNEKLKKSVQDEGLMLGQEVEDEELLDALDLPTSPIPVEIITVSSPSTLPPAGKGILITAGFMQKPPSEKKEVKFADGVCPGEGTSTSGGEDIISPPPKPKLPKEKRYKKKKTKVKKKVKVQIIRQIIQDDDEDDDLSPPPPPPGDPPPVFFARFPFASNAQFPVYHTQQTTTTTLTTIQYQTPAFP